MDLTPPFRDFGVKKDDKRSRWDCEDTQRPFLPTEDRKRPRMDHEERPRVIFEIEVPRDGFSQVFEADIPKFRTPNAIPKVRSGEYEHRNLSSDENTRVLKLRGGEWTDPVQIEFSQTSLRSPIDYMALSYTWGNPEPAAQVIVDNSEGARMTVTPNLETALRQLRHHSESQILWVDALCINQDEESEEKGQQIQQMDLIYSKAKQVIVWLGEASENSSLAMSFIKTVSDLSKIDELTKDKTYLVHWQALGALMRRSWFSRRWVVQELALAPKATVHCGSETVTWPEFSDAVSLFQTKAIEIQTLFDHDSYILGEIQGLQAHSHMRASHNLFAHSKQGSTRQPLATLEQLLCNLSSFQVTNPWDTVFALAGLARDVVRHGKADMSKYRGAVYELSGTIAINIDYKISLLDLLASMVFALLCNGSADIICQSWAPPPAHTKIWYDANKANLASSDLHFYSLPSWIRDITESEYAPRSDKYGVQHDRINAKSFVGEPGSPIYNASAGVRIRTENLKCGSILDESVLDGFIPVIKLLGYYIDSIDNGGLGGYAQRGGIPPDWLEFGSWKDHRNSPAPDQFWRTLVADRALDGGRPPVWYRLACEHAWSKTAAPSLDTDRVLRNCGSSMTAEFIRKVRQTVWNRQMFLTKKKLLGLGPSNSHSTKTVRGNDIVFVLLGCSVPVILRKYPNSTCYVLVGECYVHGVMDGAAFEEFKKAGQQPTDIWLV